MKFCLKNGNSKRRLSIMRTAEKSELLKKLKNQAINAVIKKEDTLRALLSLPEFLLMIYELVKKWHVILKTLIISLLLLTLV